MVLQSENMAKILDAYPKDLFADSTFKICPKPFSQLLVLRVNDYFHNAFHTVCFILMKNKTKFLYMKGLVKMKCNYKNIYKTDVKVSVIHCDFEEGLKLALVECFPEAKIKHCFFHYGQILYRKITSTGINGLNINKKFEESRNVHKVFYMLKYLCFIDPKFVEPVFSLIKERIKIDVFMNPFVNYFYENFLYNKDINSWNYWNIYNNRTNNCCEGYNSRLNDFFKTKPHIFKFLLKLKDEESLIYKNYIQIEFTLFKKYRKD